MNLVDARTLNTETKREVPSGLYLDLKDGPILKKYLEAIDVENHFYIDIGASYHFNMPEETVKKSDLTIFFEADLEKISRYNNWNLDNFHLITEKATPDNVVGLIRNITNNSNPKLLDLDIDGYDFFVLESLLKEITPSLIVAEINEKIPPPIKFSVKYDPDYWWDTSHFYGMSLSKCCELLNEHGYELINLTFNNVYAVRKDKNPGFKAYSASEAYNLFYRYAGWETYFHSNENMRPLLRLGPEKGVEWLQDFFKDYDKDKYDLYI